MANLALLAENALAKSQYSSRTLVATNTSGVSEEVSGQEAWRVSTGRRSRYTNFFSSLTANVEIWLVLTCDRVRAFNGFALDRDHNLTRLICEVANESTFASPETVFDVTLPTVTGPGSIDDAYGVRTEEGAWAIRYNQRAGKYWRWRIPAMGAGIRPFIVGMYLGNWIETDWIRPASEDAHDLIRETAESNFGWQGHTKGARRRGYQLTLQLATANAYELFRTQVDGFFGDGWPMWLVHDTAHSERAVLAKRNGAITWELPTDHGFRECRLPWIEHEPKVAP